MTTKPRDPLLAAAKVVVILSQIVMVFAMVMLGIGLGALATVGRAEVMAVLDARSRPRADVVWATNTLNGNPVCAAAGCAALDVLSLPGTYERLHAVGRRLRGGLVAAEPRPGGPPPRGDGLGGAWPWPNPARARAQVLIEPGGVAAILPGQCGAQRCPVVAVPAADGRALRGESGRNDRSAGRERRFGDIARCRQQRIMAAHGVRQQRKEIPFPDAKR